MLPAALFNRPVAWPWGGCFVLHNTFSPSRCGGLCGAIGPSGYRPKKLYTLARLYSGSLSSSARSMSAADFPPNIGRV